MNNSQTAQAFWEENAVKCLIALLVLFFFAKIVHIYTPLFHDELGFYGRAFFYMLDHGPSMMPGDIDPQLSRGHPLFFVFFVSWVSSWFGSSYVPARCLIILLSLALLATTYFLGKEMGGKKVGLLAAFCLAFQPLFFAQSTLILPEVMLALLGTLSILFYIQKRYWWYFLTASLMVLTKETGIVLFAGVALNEWYQNRFKITLSLVGRVVKWSIPFSCFILFLIVQKYQNGWFLFPFHTGLISFGIGDILVRFTLNCVIVLLDQGRFLLLIAVIIAIRKKDKAERKSLLDEHFVFVSLGLMMLAFSSINYVMTRYLVLLLPVLMVSFITILAEQGYTKKLLLIFFFLTLPFQYSFLIFRQDSDMGYLITVQNMKKSIGELDKISQGRKMTIYARFPELNGLEYPRDGYTNNPNYNIVDKYDETVDYILKSDHGHLAVDEFINNVEYVFDNNLDSIIYNPEAYKNSGFELIYESTYFYNHQRLFKTNNNGN